MALSNCSENKYHCDVVRDYAERGTTLAEEKPYVYHVLPASQHTGGMVLKAAASPDSTAIYTIDLGGEPAPVYSYLHLHPDTAQAIQGLNISLSHSPAVMVEARIRQYAAAGQSGYSTPQAWQVIPNGQPYAMDFSTDYAAIAAGGVTLLEYRTSPVGMGSFAPFTEVAYEATLYTMSAYELRDVLVTICDEKDNYRFGFNTQEKVNEINGIGNHNTAKFGELETRLGNRWNTDPKPSPSISPYAMFSDNPIWHTDMLLDSPKFFGKAMGSPTNIPLRDKADFVELAFTKVYSAVKNFNLNWLNNTWMGKQGNSYTKGRGYTQKGGQVFTTKEGGGADAGKNTAVHVDNKAENIDPIIGSPAQGGSDGVFTKTKNYSDISDAIESFGNFFESIFSNNGRRGDTTQCPGGCGLLQYTTPSGDKVDGIEPKGKPVSAYPTP